MMISDKSEKVARGIATARKSGVVGIVMRIALPALRKPVGTAIVQRKILPHRQPRTRRCKKRKDEEPNYGPPAQIYIIENCII